MERRELLVAAPAAMLTAAGLARAEQTGIDQIDGSPSLVGIREVAVPMCRRTDVRSLLDAGVFSAEGFTSLVMNLAGQLRGADLAGGDVGPDDPGHGALVGQGQRAIAERVGLAHQLLRVGSTAQEAEIADAMEFGVVRRHGGRGARQHGHVGKPGGERFYCI